ncbi:MAG: ATP-dependent DNA helicase RecG [Bacilli bacterium]|nr:ATP-dependent DNA helicase RecG [Bacilli bacterium]
MNVELLKGIGPKTSKILNKLDIYTIEDLVTYYPFRYDILKRTDMSKVMDGDKVILDGYLEEDAKLFRYGRNDRMTFRFFSSNNIYNVTIFNRGFLKSKLLVGTNITIIGKYDKKFNSIVASDLHFGLLPNKTEIVPIYHITPGITSKQLNEYVNMALPFVNYIDSYIPDYLEEKYNFDTKINAIKELHNPTSTNNFKLALSRLKFEELFVFMMKMTYLKNSRKAKDGLMRNVDYKEVEDFINNLPFTLTIDQLSSVKDIYNDLISQSRMNRLLQGDVGSGKTVISFIALYINYLSGYQGALMAPTEILANQHLINIQKIFKDYDIKVKLLTGKMKTSEKKKINEELKNGNIDILIGTHALFQDDIVYKNLGLVITDEQHRFGVNQRQSLKNKGITPDILYMSATPIPRTYALTIYGDMDVSSIKTMPSGRKKVITNLYKEENIKDVLEAMYKELLSGHQIYVVAPLIEESDKSDMENTSALEEKMNKAFGKKYTIGVLHGKMTSLEKDKVMEDFKNNKIQILVSTTVIEVGVDVKNATMIVIFDAYRFGLSALHQLRGRVGRNDLQSYCLLISDKESKRLEVLTKTSDGFVVAEEDFKLRGSGDLFGQRQSGDMNFKLANIKNDFNVLLKAKEEAEFYLKSDVDTNKIVKKMLIESTNLD